MLTLETVKYIALLYIVPAVVLCLVGFLLGKSSDKYVSKRWAMILILFVSLFYSRWAADMGALPAGKWAAWDWTWLCIMIAWLWVAGFTGLCLGQKPVPESEGVGGN